MSERLLYVAKVYLYTYKNTHSLSHTNTDAQRHILDKKKPYCLPEKNNFLVFTE